MKEAPHDAITAFEQHRNRILEWLTRYAHDERIGPKYLWMTSFYNWMLHNRLPPEFAKPLVVPDAPTRGFRAFDRELLNMPAPPIDPDE